MSGIIGHRARTIVLAVGFALFGLQASAVAATKVAVIEAVPGGGMSWCNFLISNGYECTIFPPSGPTQPMDPFHVVIDLSEDWTDPTGSLADFMRAGKGVVLRGSVPGALGIETDPVVQAWVGAAFLTLGNGVLLTTASDAILGSIPPGTIIGSCGDGPCSGLGGESGFPNVKVLARWESGTTSVGIMRNTWETGRSIYLHYDFIPQGPPNEEILLRTMQILSRPIPTLSTWGLIVTTILLLVVGSLILHRNPVDGITGRTRTTGGNVLIVGFFCISAGLGVAQGQQTNEIIVQNDGQGTHLYLNGAAGEPFHVTNRSVVNTRIKDVPGYEVLLLLWDEVAPDSSMVPFYAISPDGQQVARVSEASHVLPLTQSRFDPVIGVPDVGQVVQAAALNDMYIIQFWTQPIPEFQSTLENLGVNVRGYLPTQSVIAAIPAISRDQIVSLPFVRWIGPFHPAYRLEEDVLAEVVAGASPVEFRNYSIMLWERGAAAQAIVAERIAQLGGCVRRIAPDEHHLIATLTLEQVREIAKLTEVAFIDVPGDVELDVDIARNLSGANHLETVGNFTGLGVCGEVMDNWLATAPLHVDFTSRPLILHGPNDHPIASHGTRVFGLLFGDGTCQSNGRGILPSAQGIFASWFPTMANEPPGGDCGTPQQGERYTHTAQLLGDPYFAVFQSNSWGHVPKTPYTIISAELDDIAFSLDLTVCQSQGNWDTRALWAQAIPRPEASAKNVISVGGLEHKDNAIHSDDEWCRLGIPYSGCAVRGPAADGRVKPDLIHFSDGVVRTTHHEFTECTTPCYTCYVEYFGGTSAATPITCGYAGLVFQMWHEQVFLVWNGISSVLTGGGASVFADRPHASTVKAMLINTAYRHPLMTEPPLYRPDFTRDNIGWGIVDVATLYEQRNTMFIVNETDLLTNLATRIYTYTVPSGSPALRVTLAYSDPPADPCSSVHLVNDLSVKVVSPSGAVYWGNWGLINYPLYYADYYFELPYVGNWSLLDTQPADVKKDHANNVENVFIKNPQVGNWTITVSADAIIPGHDGHVETPALDADYALVVSSGERPRGRCCQTSCTPSYHCECSWTSKATCTGTGKVWSSEATCADDCGNTCPNTCIE